MGGIEITWGTALYQLVIFIVLLLLLKRFALGPLLNVMQKRQDQVEADLAEAEKTRKETEELLTAQREELDNARSEAQNIIERATKTADKQAQDLLDRAQEQADRLQQKAQSDIQREKEQAISEVRDQVGVLSVMLASKIIEKELDESAQRELIDDYLKDVGGRV